jgi:hypothetical protein
MGPIQPRVVVLEYNAKFRPPIEWIMPYKEDHWWDGTHKFGASLSSYCKLMERLGYYLVGCNITGANAFFVRADLVGEKFAAPFTAENHFEPARYWLAMASGHPTEVPRLLGVYAGTIAQTGKLSLVGGWASWSGSPDQKNPVHGGVLMRVTSASCATPASSSFMDTGLADLATARNDSPMQADGRPPEALREFRLHDLRHAFAIASLIDDSGCVYRLNMHLRHGTVTPTEGYLRILSGEGAQRKSGVPREVITKGVATKIGTVGTKAVSHAASGERRSCIDYSNFNTLEEGKGFEPSVRLDTVQRFSKPPPSATRPPLRRREGLYGPALRVHP